jgi:RNA polymerase sigma-70 factor (ECF subfamily)
MRQYQDMVYSTAARLLGDAAQAEDIAQGVFLKAYERFDELRSSPTVAGWLKTVATNQSLNHLSRYRKRWQFFSDRRSGDDDDGADPEFGVPDTALEDLDADQRRDLIEAALDSLPNHQRVPLVLFHFEEMPYQDIAERLNVSVGKIKTDIHRGRAALAQLLTARGVVVADLQSRSDHGIA